MHLAQRATRRDQQFLLGTHWLRGHTTNFAAQPLDLGLLGLHLPLARKRLRRIVPELPNPIA